MATTRMGPTFDGGQEVVGSTAKARIRLADRRQALAEFGRTGLAQVLGSHALDDALWDRPN
jgi:hypothetical protein